MGEAEEMLGALRQQREIRGLSRGYIADAEYVVRAFLGWIGDSDLESISRDVVEEWLTTALDVEEGTRRNYIGHLHQFFLFVADRTGRSELPTEKIRRPRQPRRLPHPIRDEHLRLAVDRAPNPEMRCWLLLAAYGGLRCQEIAGVDVDHVREDTGFLLIKRGKGREERQIAMHPAVLRALRDLPMPPSGPLFCMTDGRRVTPHVVSQRINRHLDHLGVPSTAHALRHWFGTNLLRSTHDLRIVQDALGHSSVATTQIYTAFDQERQTEAVRALTYGSRAQTHDLGEADSSPTEAA